MDFFKDGEPSWDGKGLPDEGTATQNRAGVRCLSPGAHQPGLARQFTPRQPSQLCGAEPPPLFRPNSEGALRQHLALFGQCHGRALVDENYRIFLTSLSSQATSDEGPRFRFCKAWMSWPRHSSLSTWRDRTPEQLWPLSLCLHKGLSVRALSLSSCDTEASVLTTQGLRSSTDMGSAMAQERES